MDLSRLFGLIPAQSAGITCERQLLLKAAVTKARAACLGPCSVKAWYLQGMENPQPLQANRAST